MYFQSCRLVTHTPCYFIILQDYAASENSQRRYPHTSLPWLTNYEIISRAIE